MADNDTDDTNEPVEAVAVTQMGATFGERKKAREAAEKKAVKPAATENKAVKAASTKARNSK